MTMKMMMTMTMGLEDIGGDVNRDYNDDDDDDNDDDDDDGDDDDDDDDGFGGYWWGCKS